MGTWQNHPDPKTEIFLKTALSNLQKNLSNPASATHQATIATIFLLSMHEVILSLFLT
jgi:hypothetical protein